MTIDNQDSDESLMVRIQSGDHQAFSLLVNRHTQQFYACAYRLCSQSELAEDIVQEAFLKLWAKPDIWKEGKGAKFTTWFYKVVTNLTLDALRKKQPTSSSDTLDLHEDRSAAQDETLFANEEQAALEGAIATLPERQRVALNLCFYEELSNKDAAEIMGVKVKALESLLMRAKTGLRDELKRQNILSKEESYG